MSMTFPTIHLNGTAREDLLEALQQALQALREAQAKLQGTAPNGRDYYPQGPAAIWTAEYEHRHRMQKLLDVERELGELAQHVVMAGEK